MEQMLAFQPIDPRKLAPHFFRNAEILLQRVGESSRLELHGVQRAAELWAD